MTIPRVQTEDDFHVLWLESPDQIIIDGQRAHLVITIPMMGHYRKDLKAGLLQECYSHETGIGYIRTPSPDEMDEVYKEIEQDHAVLQYVTGWTSRYFNRTLKVLHSPRGYSWR